MHAGWYWWELSWIAITHIGAVQLVMNLPLAKHIYDAFLAGGWSLFWNDKTLFWSPKPTVRVERMPNGGRRLHSMEGPACVNEIENLYFIHGVLVPAYAVVRPEWITLDEIKSESNEEVRRTLIEQFGWERFLQESKATIAHRQFNQRDRQWEELYRLDDGTQRVLLSDPSTGRRYALGVPSEIANCADAQAWLSHGLDRRAVHRS